MTVRFVVQNSTSRTLSHRPGTGVWSHSACVCREVAFTWGTCCHCRELQAHQGQPGGKEGLPELQPGVLASQATMERLLDEDPRWQEATFVLRSYKTEPCLKPPRLCRQGYACPHFHSSRDRRRNPRTFPYRWACTVGCMLGLRAVWAQPRDPSCPQVHPVPQCEAG